MTKLHLESVRRAEETKEQAAAKAKKAA